MKAVQTEITDRQLRRPCCADTKNWLHDADGFGIVGLYAMKNGAALDVKQKEVFSEHYSFPIVCERAVPSSIPCSAAQARC